MKRAAGWVSLLACASACAGNGADAGGVDAPGAGGSGAANVTVEGALGGAANVTFEVESEEVAQECMRDVTLTAVTLDEPPPFDLIIVADHSDSLAWSKAELSSGLATLLENVQGRDVRVFLLTPTQYGASSAAGRATLTGDPLVPWQDPETGQAYENAMTTYTQECFRTPDEVPIECPDPALREPYRFEGRWELDMPPPIAVITADMSPSAFQEQQAAVADAIVSIGGTGAPQEQPLCTLSRYVSQDPALLPEHVVFLVISDEDDVSTPEDCLVSYRGELRVMTRDTAVSACADGCDAYRYSMTGEQHWIRYPFTCMAEDDLGNAFPDTAMSSWYNTENVESCDGFVSVACSAEVNDRVSEFCDAGLALQTCESECATRQVTCNVDLPDNGTDACTQPFAYEGASYANLLDYCSRNGGVWTGCTGGGINREQTEQYSGTRDPEPITPGEDTSALIQYIGTRASTVYADGDYLVEAIVLDERFPCAPNTGQIYAHNIATLVGSDNHVFSLCEPYAPALDGIGEFARGLIQREYPLALQKDENVETVWVTDSTGEERTLTQTQYDYDSDTAMLVIADGALTAADTGLRVEVISDCRPIIK